MIMKLKWYVAVAGLFFVTMLSTIGAAQQQDNTELLRVREAVWRAWFAGDEAMLKQLVPPGSIAINSGDPSWQTQAEILQSAVDFHAHGGKLIRLEFPRTEVQRFGDVAVTYSQYQYEIEDGGKRIVRSGRATEIFVLRDGKWTNPGWHTDSEGSH
jgi:ketosteroid isomerase-like protein